MKIGIDIMGGDFAPEKTVHGAILAQKELPSNTKIVLFGKKEKILSQLKIHNAYEDLFEIIDCKETINMGDHAIKAFKQKSHSSISVGFHYLSLNHQIS